MKNKMLCVIFLLLLIASAAVFLMPADLKSFEKENRTAAAMPSFDVKKLKNGTFMTEFESYVNDNIGFRSFFTNAAKEAKKYYGIEPPEGKVIYTNKDIGTKKVKKACLLLLEDKVMEAFSQDRESADIYAAAVNDYYHKFGEKINVYNMIIPTQLQFEKPVYKNIQSDQKTAIDYIYSSLDDGIRTVDVYSELEQNTDKYIYFRTDHHWTALGAYQGYKAFAKSAGFEPIPLGSVEKNTLDEGFLGYLYNQVEEESLKEYEDHVEWFDVTKLYDLEYYFKGFKENGKEYEYGGMMFDHEKTNYNFFFKSDHPYVKIHNNTINNGKTILLIKDSYANAFAPWLVNDFENVIMVDPRSYKGNIESVIGNDNVTDMMFIHYVFTTTFADYCEMMTDMIN